MTVYSNTPPYYETGAFEQQPPPVILVNPPKEEQITLILALTGFLLGINGIHRLYLEDGFIGFIQLFFSPIFYAIIGCIYCYLPIFIIIMIWNLIDIIRFRELTRNANFRLMRS